MWLGVVEGEQNGSRTEAAAVYYEGEVSGDGDSAKPFAWCNGLHRLRVTGQCCVLRLVKAVLFTLVQMGQRAGAAAASISTPRQPGSLSVWRPVGTQQTHGEICSTWRRADEGQIGRQNLLVSNFYRSPYQWNAGGGSGFAFLGVLSVGLGTDMSHLPMRAPL